MRPVQVHKLSLVILFILISKVQPGHGLGARIQDGMESRINLSNCSITKGWAERSSENCATLWPLLATGIVEHLLNISQVRARDCGILSFCPELVVKVRHNSFAMKLIRVISMLSAQWQSIQEN